MDILYSHHLVIPPNSCPDLRRFSSRLVLIKLLKLNQSVPETYTHVILKWKVQRYVNQVLRSDRDLVLSYIACDKQGKTSMLCAPREDGH